MYSFLQNTEHISKSASWNCALCAAHIYLWTASFSLSYLCTFLINYLSLLCINLELFLSEESDYSCGPVPPTSGSTIIESQVGQNPSEEPTAPETSSFNAHIVLPVFSPNIWTYCTHTLATFSWYIHSTGRLNWIFKFQITHVWMYTCMCCMPILY